MLIALVKYYSHEVETGLDTCNSQVAGSWFRKAVSNGPSTGRDLGDLLAEDPRAAWRETSNLAIGGNPDAPPIAGKMIITLGDGSS